MSMGTRDWLAGGLTEKTDSPAVFRSWLAHLVFLLIYVDLAWLGMRLVSLPLGNLAVIWLPSGVALTALLILGWRAAVTVFVASFLANAPWLYLGHAPELLLRTGLHALVSAGFDTLQPVLACWIYRRLFRDSPFKDGLQFLRFVGLVALLPCTLTGWGVVLNMHFIGFFGDLPMAEVGLRMVNIVMADTLGIFLVLPLVASFQQGAWRDRSRRGLLRQAAALALVLLAAFLTFSLQAEQAKYLIIPALLGMAVCGGLRGSAVGMLAWSWYSIVCTARGQGPFVEEFSLLSSYNLILFILLVGSSIHYAAIVLEQLHWQKANLEHLVAERTESLQAALDEIRTLSGIVPICSYCKQIRDDRGYWEQVETYVERHSQATFTHGICPDCFKEHFPELPCAGR